MKITAELQQENERLKREIAVEKNSKRESEKLLIGKEKLVKRDSHIAILNERIKYLLQQRFAPYSITPQTAAKTFHWRY